MEGEIKQKVNEKFFLEWSPNMAYILGYIAADGCLIKRNGRINSWMLNITSKDKEHLEKINDKLDSTYSIAKKFNGHGDTCYQICISNFDMCMSLLKLGIEPRKTFTITPLKVPDVFFADYFRGYFDADGSVYIYNVNNVPQIKSQICSASQPFITKLTNDLSKFLEINHKPIYENKPIGKNSMYKNAFYVNESEKLFNFMYHDMNNLFLQRKYDIFIKWQSTTRRKYIAKSTT